MIEAGKEDAAKYFEAIGHHGSAEQIRQLGRYRLTCEAFSDARANAAALKDNRIAELELALGVIIQIVEDEAYKVRPSGPNYEALNNIHETASEILGE